MESKIMWNDEYNKKNNRDTQEGGVPSLLLGRSLNIKHAVARLQKVEFDWICTEAIPDVFLTPWSEFKDKARKAETCEKDRGQMEDNVTL